MFHAFGNNPITYTDPDGREDWVPLTRKKLWRIAFQSGNLSRSEKIKNNQIVGGAFEQAVGKIFGKNKNSVAFSTDIRPSPVIPDFIEPLTVVGFTPEGSEILDYYSMGTFIEAKTAESVDLNGSTPKQMMAMIDACANQVSINNNKSGKNGVALLFLVTPSDTKISSDLIRYANSKHVLLYHFKALYNKDTQTQIKLSEGKLLTFPYNKDMIVEPIKIELGIGVLEF